MGNRAGARLLFGLLAIVALTLVGVYAYQLGVNRGVAWGIAQGVAQSAAQAGTEAGRAPVIVPFGPYGMYGPWGYWPRPWGFGFFPFFPILFILFWILVFRGLFWRGYRWRHGWSHAQGGVPPFFDEWHRRAHGQAAPDKQQV